MWLTTHSVFNCLIKDGEQMDSHSQKHSHVLNLLTLELLSFMVLGVLLRRVSKKYFLCKVSET